MMRTSRAGGRNQSLPTPAVRSTRISVALSRQSDRGISRPFGLSPFLLSGQHGGPAFAGCSPVLSRFLPGLRRKPLLLLLIFLLAMAAGTSRQARGQQDDVPGVPTAVRIALNETAFRRSGHAAHLQRARQALAEDRQIAGLTYLQQIFDDPVDAFVWNPETGQLSGARRLAARILDEQPAAVHEACERIYGPDAGRLLKQALRSGSTAQLLDVSRRYYHTQAGFTAVSRRAARLFDYGQFDAAARLYERLLTDRVHRHRVTPLLAARASLARRFSGSNHITRFRLTDNHATPPLRVAESQVQPAAWSVRRSDAVSPSSFTAGSTSWLVPLGHESNSHIAPGSPPWLRPAWRHDLLTECHEYVGQMLDEWEKQQRRTDRPLAQAVSGLVAAGSLLVRDPDGIRAIELHTGKLRWRYRCSSALSAAARRSSGRYRRQGGGSRRGNTWVDYVSARVRNSVLGTLTSDGELVFAVDQMELVSLRQGAPVPRGDSPELSVTKMLRARTANRLIALPLRPGAALSTSSDAPVPVWTAGGLPSRPATTSTDTASSEPADEAPPSLTGHFFFGPPLPSGGRLYVVSEREGQLYLSCLTPENGEICWMQNLGYSDLPVATDVRRYPAACLPAAGSGIIVCPTGQGILVAVDAETGSLVWVSFYGDYGDPSASRSWTQRSHRTYGHGGFLSPPVISNGRVVYLPRESSSIHCVDLHTGRAAWAGQPPPRKDAEYIAGVHQGTVLLVGSRYCRGLSLDSGEELWSSRISMPSGRGLCLGTSLLIPLQTGRVALLDVATGQETGRGLGVAELMASDEASSRPQRPDSSPPSADTTATSTGSGASADSKAAATAPPHWTGNLLASHGMIYSITPREVVAFPQAAPRLEQLQNRIADEGLTAEDALTAAELEMTLGHPRLARQNLEHVLRHSTTPSGTSRAEFLLREVIYRSLDSSAGNQRALLARLERLARTPEQRCRYLVALAQDRFDQHDFDGMMAALDELHALPVKVTGDTRHSVAIESWIGGLTGQVPEWLSGEQRDQVQTRVDLAQAEALATNTPAALNRFLVTLGNWPQARAVELQLAHRLLEHGQHQQAELLLLRVQHGDDQELARQALRARARLYDDLGLAEETVRLLDQLQLCPVPGQQSPGISRGFGFSPATQAAWKRSRGPAWPVHRVQVAAHAADAEVDKLRESFRRYRRRFLTPARSGYLLLDQGTNREGSISVISRAGGVVAGRVRIPSRNSYPSVARDAHIGHFFPLGGNGSMHGVSLLELSDGDPLWTVTTPTGGSSHEVLRVGPAGPDFCTFQKQRQLIVLSPRNGELRWQRSDLEPHSGLLSDPYTGLYGDDQALVAFGPDHESWTVWRTATGEEIHSGRLPIDRRAQRRVWGRHLLYFTPADEHGIRRMRIWDALTDTCLLDRQVRGRVQTAETGDDRLVVVESEPFPAEHDTPAEQPAGRIQLIDPATGRVELTVPLTAEETQSLSYIRVFQDRHRWFFSFQKAVRQPEERRRSYYASDTFLPAAHIQGSLFAVDRRTGQRLWSRSLPQRSVLDLTHLNLPFLVTLSRIRDRHHGNRQSLLVEVLDAATGRTIGRQENLFPDRIVHLGCEPDEGRITLRGLRSAVRLDFSRRTQALERLDDPL